MSNPLEGTNSSAHIIVTETTIGNSNQQEHNAENVSVNSSEQVDCPIKSKRKRTKTSLAWNDFDEIEFPGGIKKAQCKFCKEKLSITGKANPFMTPGGRYSNEKMREVLVTAIMMHELPFNIVDAQEWKLQKRVLSFVKVLAPRRGVDVADVIFKCLKSWGIDEKVFSVSIDNASYNDSCLKTLEENISCDSRLVLDGALFHVRCCAHILNLLVQDGLKEIKDVIYNIRESVKYINHNDSSEFPIANLYLAEVASIKDVIDKASKDENHFMREMVAPMKIKFDKYWGGLKSLDGHYKCS
ncbi:hypothetical protein Lal_00042433 [Lupinus albus]|nr:hypothetical protein Lal_00042433 [Lupinus albus]